MLLHNSSLGPQSSSMGLQQAGVAADQGDEQCLVKHEDEEKEDAKAGEPPALANKDPDYASVVTQVTRSGPPPAFRGPTSFRIDQPVLPRQSWKSKVRSIFCCFAPQSHGYIRTTEGDHPGAGRSHLAPVPPRVHREAVVGPKRQDDLNKKTLVLDLDETLVHSSFKPIPNPDYIIPVEIDGKVGRAVRVKGSGAWVGGTRGRGEEWGEWWRAGSCVQGHGSGRVGAAARGQRGRGRGEAGLDWCGHAGHRGSGTIKRLGRMVGH